MAGSSTVVDRVGARWKAREERHLGFASHGVDLSVPVGRFELTVGGVGDPGELEDGGADIHDGCKGGDDLAGICVSGPVMSDDDGHSDPA